MAEGNIALRPDRYEVVPTAYGFVVGSGRPLEDGRNFWTANVMVMPFHKLIASAPVAAHMWVPMDDENTMRYCVTFHPHRPLTEKDVARETAWNGIHSENVPGADRPICNRDNDYLIDRALQASGASYTGIRGLGTQDNGIQESMGPIADRTKEHLGVGDTAIIAIRRFLLQTLKDHAAGAPPPGLDPAGYQVRSSRYIAQQDLSFADTMENQICLDAAVAAE